MWPAQWRRLVPAARMGGEIDVGRGGCSAAVVTSRVLRALLSCPSRTARRHVGVAGDQSDQSTGAHCPVPSAQRPLPRWKSPTNSTFDQAFFGVCPAGLAGGAGAWRASERP